jgi:hypothetical protein
VLTNEGGFDASVSEAIQMACAGIWDCFVAVVPRNDERLSAPAQRRAEEGEGDHTKCGGGLRPTVRPSPLPPHIVRFPLPATRGGIRKRVTRIDTERKRGTRDNRALYLPVEDAENDTARG